MHTGRGMKSKRCSLCPILAAVSWLVACGGPPPVAANAVATTTSAEIPTTTEESRDQVTVAPRPADEPNYSVLEEANANAVLESLAPDLLECYRARLATRPDAHAFMTVEIVVGPDGHVQHVDMTGGALLGDRARACIVHRLEGASFAPPHGGGTLDVHVPLALEQIAINATP